MVIRADRGSAGASSCRMAAWPRSRAGIVVPVLRAVRHPVRRGMMAVAAVTCAGLLAGLGAAAPAAGSASRGNIAAAVPGARLWVSRYNGPGSGDDRAAAVAASPDGSTVFATGTSPSGAVSSDYATVAYDAATGARLWASRYAGTGGENRASAVAVSPDGNTVFVTGGSQGFYVDYATAAYDAATGAQLWASRYNGPLGDDGAASIAVSPAGGTVFVTGSTGVQDGASWYATVAYNAATGAQLWASTYSAFHSFARSVAVGPAGHAVYVTGYSGNDYATVAYNAATGAQLWARRYHGPGHGPRNRAVAFAAAISPDGHTVYITGYSGPDYATVAYNAATGAQRWVRRYAGPAPGAVAFAVAAGPGGRTVYVTGSSSGVTSRTDYATIAYDAATGARRWASRYNGPANRNDIASAVAVSPGGHTVYVTGASFGGAGPGNDYATIAYDAATGARLWARRYNGPGNGADQATSVADSPAGGTVFVTGPSFGGAGPGLDYATIAYKG